jgi:hypothetical protein
VRYFTTRNERTSQRAEKVKRKYINDSQTNDLFKVLDRYFQSKVAISRIKMGKGRELETFVNEEALIFAMFLRNERKAWEPRNPETSTCS